MTDTTADDNGHPVNPDGALSYDDDCWACLNLPSYPEEHRKDSDD